jgi:hypothetical protein
VRDVKSIEYSSNLDKRYRERNHVTRKPSVDIYFIFEMPQCFAYPLKCYYNLTEICNRILKTYILTIPIHHVFTLFRNRAPAHSTGAKCLLMLKPNKLANQSIVVTAMGARRSSVWCKKGRAL